MYYAILISLLILCHCGQVPQKKSSDSTNSAGNSSPNEKNEANYVPRMLVQQVDSIQGQGEEEECELRNCDSTLGSSGTLGATGSGGSTGGLGSSGSSGTGGMTGSLGSKGSGGAAGSTGSSGAVGATGSTGSAGTTGISAGNSTTLQFQSVCGGAPRSYARDLRNPDLVAIYLGSDRQVQTLYRAPADASLFKRAAVSNIPVNLFKTNSGASLNPLRLLVTFCAASAVIPQKMNSIGDRIPGCTAFYSTPTKVDSYCNYVSDSSGPHINVNKKQALVVPYYFARQSDVNPAVDCDLRVTSPLVLDLDGDNIVKTVPVSKGIMFDLNADGSVEASSWLASSTEGVLVLDKNRNGMIDNGSELFGDATLLPNGEKARNGFEALAQFASNGAKKITKNDPIYNELKVWRNSDPKRPYLSTLSSLNIDVLYLDYLDNQTRVENGNEFRQASYFTKKGSTKHFGFFDLWFMTATGVTNPAQLTKSKTCPVTPVY